MKKSSVAVISILAIVVLFVGTVMALRFIPQTPKTINDSTPKDISNDNNDNSNIIKENNKSTTYTYYNSEYKFSVILPESWETPSIIKETWESNLVEDDPEFKRSGEIIKLRHPLWTEESPREDLPIMVFTHSDWTELSNEEFHIGAAPMNPSLLFETNDYVFALPARYNYDFLEGYEEVDEIVNNHDNFIDNAFLELKEQAEFCNVVEIAEYHSGRISATTKNGNVINLRTDIREKIYSVIDAADNKCSKKIIRAIE